MIKKLHKFSRFVGFWDKMLRKDLPCISVAKILSPWQLKGEFPIYGRGVDWNINTARLKAAMEALERYAIYAPSKGKILWGSCKDFKPFVSNYFISRTSSLGERWWIQVKNYNLNNKSYIPLEYTQLSSICSIDNPLVKADSTGYAAHFNAKTCRESASKEVVERFSLSILWNKGANCLWDEKSLPSNSQKLVDKLIDMGFELFIIPIISINKILNCTVLIIKRRKLQLLSLFAWGSAADFTADQALSKALLEAYAQAVNLEEVTSRGASNISQEYLHYTDNKNIDSFLQSIISGAITKLQYPNILQEGISQKNLGDCEIFIEDRTPKELTKLKICIRHVIIPELQALYEEKDIINPFTL